MSAIAAAIIGAGASAYAANRASKQTTSSHVRGLDKFLPPELLSIFDPNYGNPMNFNTPLGQAIAPWLEQMISGLPPEVLQRALAGITSGFGRAEEAGNRNAALGLGPNVLSGPLAEINRARASADTQANFAAQSQEQRMAALVPLLSFFNNIQNTRFGNPASTTISAPGAGTAAGAFQGAGQGLQLASGQGWGFGQLFGNRGQTGSFGSQPGGLVGFQTGPNSYTG